MKIFNSYILIASDSVKSLRKQDVYRLLEKANGHSEKEMMAFAEILAGERPDFKEEIMDCMLDLGIYR